MVADSDGDDGLTFDLTRQHGEQRLVDLSQHILLKPAKLDHMIDLQVFGLVEQRFAQAAFADQQQSAFTSSIQQHAPGIQQY